MRGFLKLIGWLGGTIVALFILMILVGMRVPTAHDAQVSEQIRLAFEQEVNTNFPASKHLSIISTPRRNSTVIIVSGSSLTDEEQKRLVALAERVGKANDDRSVSVVFRDR